MNSEEQLKMEVQSEMGNWIMLKRKEKGITQEHLGIKVGYSPQAAKQAISQIERGLSWIPAKKQAEFLEVLDLDKAFMSLVSYHYFSRNYTDALQKLKERGEAEIAHKTRNMRIQLKVEGNEPAPSEQNSDIGVEEKLRKLKELFDKGLIDEKEYKDSKADVLKQYLG